MNFIRSLFQKYFEKYFKKGQRRNRDCDLWIEELRSALSELESFFAVTNEFIEPETIEIWRIRHADLEQYLHSYHLQRLKRADNYEILISLQQLFFRTTENLGDRIVQHNHLVENRKINAAYALIGRVGGRELDRQQMLCIARKAYNHLVIAGAGTGKTTTIVGKIKLLLKSRAYRPEDILVLSFTNASAAEMRERIQKETGQQIEACTFHKLGKNIITRVEGITPKITQIDLRKFVKERLMELLKEPGYINLWNGYLMFNRIPAKSEFEFHTEEEYQEYLQVNPPQTIKYEQVKSYGELDIANFLYQNGIEYQYEEAYRFETRTEEYGQYHPDFHLTESDIYIEYFGIDRKGEVPKYFKAPAGKTPAKAYRESMEWKRKLHKTNGTTMIECFAYEKMEGMLLKNLELHLKEKGVVFRPKAPEELWKEIEKGEKTVIDGMVDLFLTLINQIKSNAYTIDMVRKMNAHASVHRAGNDKLLSLVEPIFLAYHQKLEENGEIDFNDMIHLATEYIRRQKYRNPYRFVIVDEYQDISKARFELLKSLRESGNFELFCVGDDWQSIYRFTGSDISYIVDFENYWGKTLLGKIETTYRFSRQLIEISGSFVMKNPMQIKKQIRGKYSGEQDVLNEIQGSREAYAVNKIREILDKLPENSSVFFIGRYVFDREMLENSGFLHCRYHNGTEEYHVSYAKRPDLKMKFLTVHKSKGLQADYVFILNNKKSRMGFPSRVQDAPIMSLLLNQGEQYPFAEERRLFYVALTRAKKKVFLLTVKGQESKFILELRKKYEDEMKRAQYLCPWCGGRLVKKTGKFGEFLGCSNYRRTGCTYTRQIGWKNRRK